MIFQSLGSNHTLKQVIHHLFARGSVNDSKILIDSLENRYGGTAFLYAKGRYALSEATRISATKNQSVAINGLTCSVVADAVRANGHKVLVIDVAKNTGHFDAVGLDGALSESENAIGAVIVQNTYGEVCDIAAIERIAEKHNVYLIEDMAHSIGQYYADGREVGTVGDLAMISFGRDKLLDVTNGGALIVRNPDLLSRVQPPAKEPSLMSQLRDRIYPLLNWKVRTFWHVLIGKVVAVLMYKLHLATLSSDGKINTAITLPHWQARLANERLQTLDTLLAGRRNIMRIYNEHLSDHLLNPNGTIRAALLVNNRTAALAKLRANGYELVDTWYDTPIGPKHKYKQMNYPEEDCPNAVDAAAHMINLPTHQYVTERDAEKIATIVKVYR